MVCLHSVVWLRFPRLSSVITACACQTGHVSRNMLCRPFFFVPAVRPLLAGAALSRTEGAACRSEEGAGPRGEAKRGGEAQQGAEHLAEGRPCRLGRTAQHVVRDRREDEAAAAAHCHRPGAPAVRRHDEPDGGEEGYRATAQRGARAAQHMACLFDCCECRHFDTALPAASRLRLTPPLAQAYAHSFGTPYEGAAWQLAQDVEEDRKRELAEAPFVTSIGRTKVSACIKRLGAGMGACSAPLRAVCRLLPKNCWRAPPPACCCRA